MQHAAIYVVKDCMALSINLVQRYGFFDTKQWLWRENLIFCGCRDTTALQTCAETSPIRRVVGLSHWGSRTSSYCGKQNTAAVVRQPYRPARGTTPISAGCRAVPLGQPHIIVLRQTKYGCRGTTALQPCAGDDTHPAGCRAVPLGQPQKFGAAAYYRKKNSAPHGCAVICSRDVARYVSTIVSENSYFPSLSFLYPS